MLHVHSIASLDHPDLAPYLTMRRHVAHQQQRLFVAEGDKVVRRLLESKFQVVSVLLPEEWRRKLEPLLQRRTEEIHVFVAPKEQLETLTGFSFYQGVLAVGKIPYGPSSKEIISRGRRPHLLVAADGISNAENMGVLVRNSVAFGVQALISGPDSSSPFLRRAVRSSMGAVFNLPILETASLEQTLADLRTAGIRCVAAHPHTEQRFVAQAGFRADCCVVFGSEGQGLSPAVLELCDEQVAIPMHRGVDSLNVGSASAAFLYEVDRQRRG